MPKDIRVTRSAPPPVVSKRNHFMPLEQVVDDVLHRLPAGDKLFTRGQVRLVCSEVARVTAIACEGAYAKAATNGIKQAHLLLQNPDFYATVQNRRKQDLKRNAEYEAQQRAEALERDHDPVYRKKHLADLHHSVDYARAHLEHMETKLSDCIARYKTAPKLTRMPLPSQDPDD